MVSRNSNEGLFRDRGSQFLVGKFVVDVGNFDGTILLEKDLFQLGIEESPLSSVSRPSGHAN